LALGFEYSVDEEEFMESDFLGKNPEDIYTWLVGAVKCTACGHIFQIIDYECA
jgi:hypothetical protein